MNESSEAKQKGNSTMQKRICKKTLSRGGMGIIAGLLALVALSSPMVVWEFSTIYENIYTEDKGEAEFWLNGDIEFQYWPNFWDNNGTEAMDAKFTESDVADMDVWDSSGYTIISPILVLYLGIVFMLLGGLATIVCGFIEFGNRHIVRGSRISLICGTVLLSLTFLIFFAYYFSSTHYPVGYEYAIFKMTGTINLGFSILLSILSSILFKPKSEDESS